MAKNKFILLHPLNPPGLDNPVFISVERISIIHDWREEYSIVTLNDGREVQVRESASKIYEILSRDDRFI